MEVTHLPIGTLLQGGKYRIVRFISSGGFGCTYEAEHVLLEKRMAVKEFFVKDFCNRDETTAHITVGTQSKKALVEKLRKKFFDEAKSVCKLEHKSIVRVSDVFEENGTAYYVMDYIKGLSLGDMVNKRGPLSEQRAVKYVRQVAEALAYVHGHNRLHLDVKPGNIMVDEHDNAILIDFGASKQYDEVNGENTSTLMGKTPGYAPPEQMGNDVSKFTPATDIYALGATLYKLLTGVTPLLSGDELPPLPEETSLGVRKAVESSMQIIKAHRPQTIADFLAMLGNAAPAPPPAPAPTPREETEFGDEVEVISYEPPAGKQIPQHEPPKPASQSPSTPPTKGEKKRPLMPAILAAVVCAVIVIVVVAVWKPWAEVSISAIPGIGEPTVGLKEEEEQNGTINGHGYVDLGLSVKWATCNVGASSSSDYGDYFAWGETTTKSEYTEENSKTYGKSMGSIAGNSQYDAARANWGSTWRLPTSEEIDELINKCMWTWTSQGGHNGYKVTGPNGNSIFLPAAGWRYGTSLDSAGGLGGYWGATPYEDGTDNAYDLLFNSGGPDRDWDYRNIGQSVRPVSE